jgi:hypothetical protein
MSSFELKCMLPIGSLFLLAACGNNPAEGTAKSAALAQADAEILESESPQVLGLKSCLRKNDNATVTAATITISSKGDMIFSGAVGGSPSRELARINFHEMSMRTVASNASSSRGNTLFAATADNRTMSLLSTRQGYFVSTSPDVTYRCDPETTAAFLSTSAK